MEKIQLSARLQLIADMVPKCKVMADVGTDHGYLPIALTQMGKVEKAYAMDINKGPLAKAMENIEKHKAEVQVTTVLSDGLEHLQSDTDVLVIAGMGGMLIGQILEKEKSKLEGLSHMLLSPHLDQEAMRRKIHALGWQIVDERMVEDKEKFYTAMLCMKGHEIYTNIEYKYGAKLISQRDPYWQADLSQRLRKLEIIKGRLETRVTENTRERLNEIIEDINEIKVVLGNEA